MKKVKQLLMAWLIAALLIPTCSINVYAAAGDSASTADELTLGVKYSGYSNQRTCFHRFTVSDSGKYHIEATTNIAYNASLSLVGPAGDYNIGSAYNPIWNNQTSSGTWGLDYWLSKGTYYIKLLTPYYKSGNYSITVSQTESANETFPSKYGDAEKATTANHIELGATTNGLLSIENKSDYYTFTVNDPGKYQITGTNAISESAKLYLIGTNGSTELGSSINTFWDNQISYGTWQDSRWLAMGTYYIRVYDYNHRGPYSLSVTKVANANETFPSSFGETESTTTADEISLGQTVNGMISEYNTSDYYRVSIPEPGTYEITGSTGISSSATISILNSKGYTVGSSYKPQWDNTSSYGTWSFTKDFSADTYYLRVYSGTNKGTYSLSINYAGASSKSDSENVSASLKKPSIKKLTSGKKLFIATWKEVKSGITGYEIQYSTDKKFKPKKTKTVTVQNRKTTSKSIKKLKKHTKYYVRLRTYKKNGSIITYSNWSKTKTVTTK